MSATDAAGLVGSLGATPPVVGSNFQSGTSLVQVTAVSGGDATYAIANGTNPQIQSAFEYPNVFDMNQQTGLIRGAAEAYAGDFNGSSPLSARDTITPSAQAQINCLPRPQLGIFFGF